jgi:hypothetical protein
VSKGAVRLDGFDNKIISIYTRGIEVLLVKICDESMVKIKAICLALALDWEGQKHVLGIW